MINVFWISSAILCALVAMAWLALSIKHHWQQSFGDAATLPNSPVLRSSALALLILSLVCCLQADHPSMASLVWIMLLALSAMTTGMVLSRKPQVYRFIVPPVFICSNPTGKHS